MADETKFTPGPWTREGRHLYGPYFTDDDGDELRLCIGLVQGAQSDDEECRANADLITAAPDLFDALAGALTAIEAVGECLGDMDAMRAALAKARGEPA